MGPGRRGVFLRVPGTRVVRLVDYCEAWEMEDGTMKTNINLNVVSFFVGALGTAPLF